MKSNLLRIIYNKRSMLVILFLFLLTIFDFSMHLIADKVMYTELGIKYHPAFASFLSNTTEGHIWQKLMLWFLPIYILLICSDHYINDVATGYNHILIGKIGKQRYIRNLMLEAFIFPMVIMFIILIINYILNLWFYHGGTDFAGLQGFKGFWFELSLYRPNLTYVIFVICTSLLTGVCGLLCSCCSLIFPDYKYAYPLTFIIWFFGISVDYSIAFLTQPFAEFGFDWLIPIWGAVIGIIIILTVSVYIYKVNTDEI